jgi:ribosomal protein L24
MKQLEVGDRVKVLTGDKDDQGTVITTLLQPSPSAGEAYEGRP